MYLYPQLYEGQEGTQHLYCTGPTPFQQVSELIPYLIKQGNKRFAMPSANYLWPQLLNKATKKVIEDNGGEVVLEEYFPLDQVAFNASKLLHCLDKKNQMLFCFFMDFLNYHIATDI